MSSRDWRFRIQDILKSIQKIETYIEGMTAGQFKKNELVIDAVVRNLEIMGEASKNISISTRRLYPDIPWDQMNGMRNILIPLQSKNLGNAKALAIQRSKTGPYY